ncbi:tRNA A-37 threonylcarbamoyl transferase component Bud32 [Crossiella equi]|uniref:tRNA A-37 threonylcarbamoyl transferase component Bud32 n=2 Tax=Crossiella equi TaxID=130796 RepID=A0ABS5AAB8_9PSEU|nr:class III lanthionine synthetase LanKC [Crossiella equi]MBP2473525.1 tRNA A-37 threonylcarbamoyl transferase component Bud32 [Crossiella equi]
MFELTQLHCFADEFFFEDVSHWREGPDFLGEREPPPGWTRTHRRTWTILHPPRPELPDQGWKVHVSGTPANAARLCTAVWDHCTARGIAFKHLRDHRILLAVNAKYAPRSGSGKLLTIYPRDEAELTTVLTGLSTVLDGEPGPRILSDLRYREGPLHVRYGAFRTMTCVDERGDWVRALRRPDGALVPDPRVPAFRPPAWVQLPAVLRTDRQPRPFPYRVDRALHFSNAGGIYLATRTADGRQVVLKEARPHTAVDENGEDAPTRQSREADALHRLSGLPGVPEPLDRFTADGHHFLVQSVVPGEPLHVWFGIHHPWVTTPDPTREAVAAYTARALRVLDRLSTLLAAIHARGLVFGDLHLGNIMIAPDDSVGLVDFELAFPTTATTWRPGLRATGFGRRDLTGLAVDRYAFAAVQLGTFLSYGRLIALDPHKVAEFVRIIGDNFPVPASWLQSVSHDLTPITTAPAHRPPLSPRTIANGIVAMAQPYREDRIFPGDVEQFAPGGGGLTLAHGAAGVLWALSVTGHGRHPAHERWLRAAATRLRHPNPGFYNGIAGVAYALHHLGHRTEAATLLDRHLAEVPERLNHSLFSGLAGIGATLLHFGDQPRALNLADNLLSRPPDGHRGAGLMHGWSGVALFLLRLFDHTADPALLDAATTCLHRDLDQCVSTSDGTLMVEEKGVRTMPYLDVGSAGIALVADELLAHRPDDRTATALPLLLRASCRRFSFQANLFQGFAGHLATLARLSPRHDHSPTLRRHLTELPWHALTYRGHPTFAGTQGVRLSTDLATGAAGVLLATATATHPNAPFLPYFSPRPTPLPHWPFP